MSNLLKFPPSWEPKRQQFDFIDDFIGLLDTFKWVATLTDTGSATVVDGPTVLPILASDGTVANNDQAYVATKTEIFLFAADRPFVGGIRAALVETVAGVANAFIGFANAVAAELLIDDGAGVRASGSIAAIYKVDGGTAWKCVTRNNGVVTDSTSSLAVDTAYHDFEVEVLPFTSTQVKVGFRVDGTPLKDSTTGLDIVHTVTVASATDMQFGFGVKIGADTNNDPLNVDAAWYACKRPSL